MSSIDVITQLFFEGYNVYCPVNFEETLVIEDKERLYKCHYRKATYSNEVPVLKLTITSTSQEELLNPAEYHYIIAHAKKLDKVWLIPLIDLPIGKFIRLGSKYDNYILQPTEKLIARKTLREALKAEHVDAKEQLERTNEPAEQTATDIDNLLRSD
ncbi:MAG: hypothetical protein CMB80_02290 [Flammeovirgaceae bacterium]|nr:hypothetical protein [Flammeovirgaceae bacterium]